MPGDTMVCAAVDPLKKTDNNNQSPEEVLIDRYFVWPEEARPDIAHDEFDEEIPVIDFSPVLKLARLRAEIAAGSTGDNVNLSNLEGQLAEYEAGRAKVETEIRAACEEYGFFQIVNHGFPINIVEQLKQLVGKIFDLPLEMKNKVSATPIPGSYPKPGYGSMRRRSGFYKAQKKEGSVWSEGFDFDLPETVRDSGRLESMINTLWPPESETSGTAAALRSTIKDFDRESNKLVLILADLMTASLDLPPNSMVESLLHSDAAPATSTYSKIRANHYPVCAQPELTWGLASHTDPSVFTMLHQDSVGGLQLCFKDGSWHGVRPLGDSFVINVGDILQAWTNGRFISAEHRVVANEKCRRFSIAKFVLGNVDKVSTRPELVDSDHPLQYRPFTKTEFYQSVAQKGLSRDRNAILQRFSHTAT